MIWIIEMEIIKTRNRKIPKYELIKSFTRREAADRLLSIKSEMTIANKATGMYENCLRGSKNIPD